MCVMRRRLFTLLSGLSLLLCVAVGVLWVRSYFVSDQVSRGFVGEPVSRAGALMAYTNHGTLVLKRYDISFEGPDLPAGFCAQKAPETEPVVERLEYRGTAPFVPPAFGDAYLLRFHVLDERRGSRLEGGKRKRADGAWDGTGIWVAQRWRGVSVPFWAPLLVFTAAPAWRLLAYRRRRRPGLCGRCGYDLRATPGRCPECGTTVEGKEA